MRRSTDLSILGVLVLAILIAQPAWAEVSEITVFVGGLSCPFCTYGVEKKLKAVDGVESVKVHLKSGTATLILAEGKVPTPEEIRRAVKKAGFTAGKIELTAIGTLSSREETYFLEIRYTDRKYVLYREDTKQTLLDEKTREHFADMAKRGAMVAVTGALHDHVEGPSGLSVNKVEELHSTTLMVEGMTDGKSAERLTSLLQKTAGVYRASVSMDDETVTVESLGERVSSSALITAIEGAGFKASVSDGK